MIASSRDPVCGMTVPEDAEVQASHREVVYRFCSEGCREKFLADPERYVEGSARNEESAPVTLPR